METQCAYANISVLCYSTRKSETFFYFYFIALHAFTMCNYTLRCVASMEGKSKGLGHIYFSPMTLFTCILATICLLFACGINENRMMAA